MLRRLVPRYLDELPADPFDGAPLRYRPEEKLVYSIGANLRDEREAKQEDEKDLLEPTYPIAF